MARYLSIPSRIIFGLFTSLLGLVLSTPAAADARISESYGELPLHFEANQGQSHQDVRFLSRGPGYSLYLTADEAVLVLSKPAPETKHDGRGAPGRRAAPAQTKPVALRMSLVGAAPAPLMSGLDELPGKANYFVGSDPEKWHTNVPTYAKVHYREVYPGIDLVYYGNQRQLEYDFVVAPGGDPRNIVLGFKGADKLEINAQGDLVLHVAGGAIRQHKPVLYQDVDGVRQEIAGSYVHAGANRIGFKVAAYDRSQPLIIDPVVLTYSTYLGGNGSDFGGGIAVDAGGNVYVTGGTLSTNFPTTLGGFQTSFGGGDGLTETGDAFVTKFNPTGSLLIYSTYIGGNSGEQGSGIAVDADGNVYVTGLTFSINFPTTAGAVQATAANSAPRGHAFVTKLNSSGSGLVYSTYLGGTDYDQGMGIATDTGGNAYVTGYTFSSDFPTTAGAFQSTSNGGAFVTKIDPTGGAFVYSTYLGAARAYGIAIDTGDSAYVTGEADCRIFSTTTGAFQGVLDGNAQVFVTKFDAAGATLAYSACIGGGSGNGIAVDAAGSAYVTGSTASTIYPTITEAFQRTIGGANDAFVTKLNPSGSALAYSTYLGGSGYDFGNGIAVDTAGNIYVTGRTASANFPITAGSVQPTIAGGDDAFAMKLDPTGRTLIYSTYLGGSGNDFGFAIAVDAAGNAYVTGATGSSNFPTTLGAFQLAFSGGNFDAFVVRIAESGSSSGTTTRFEENAATYTGYWPSYGPETGTFSGGAIVASNQLAATVNFTFNGTAVTWVGVKCNVCGIATVSIDGGAPSLVNTFGPGVPGSLVSEPVFSASGLVPGVAHTLVITVTSTSTAGVALLTGGAYIAVDAFDVTK